MPNNCAFLPRCDYAQDKCRREPWPELTLVEGQHYVACYADVQEKQ